MLRIKGNIAGIGEFGEKVGKLASAAARKSVLENVAEEAIELVLEGFDEQSDPYGKAWKPTLRGGRILQDTGRLKRSWHRRSLNSQRVVIATAVKYARYHQAGTKRMARRAMVPFKGIPPEWQRRLVAVARAAWKSSVGFK